MSTHVRSSMQIWFWSLSLAHEIACQQESVMTIPTPSPRLKGLTPEIVCPQLFDGGSGGGGGVCVWGGGGGGWWGGSGLDKDLDQCVFHPLLFNLMSILLHI